jgi:hypothetical protein
MLITQKTKSQNADICAAFYALKKQHPEYCLTFESEEGDIRVKCEKKLRRIILTIVQLCLGSI